MKTIFSTAEQVVVWLGGNVQLAFLYPTTAEITQPDEGRSSFFGNTYWRRGLWNHRQWWEEMLTPRHKTGKGSNASRDSLAYVKVSYGVPLSICWTCCGVADHY
ncbi:Uncharacterized protein HZ326_6564 [Fusarium oxysporum f. sp. albedinis]|nr:Uncharacterized protein HZ326_6564 [Fusarium oxysporum f. sp. albedinis]